MCVVSHVLLVLTSIESMCGACCTKYVFVCGGGGGVFFCVLFFQDVVQLRILTICVCLRLFGPGHGTPSFQPW